MNDDWAKLARVRDAQLTVARLAVQAGRDALAQDQAHAAAARAALAGEHAAKQALWRDLAHELSQGGGAVADLRQAHAWSGALDTRIARTAQGAQAAQAAVDLQQARLDEQQARLQRALAAAEAARSTAGRVQEQERRAQEQRAQGRIDDGAAERWLRSRRV
jgi:hypothetical protein